MQVTAIVQTLPVELGLPDNDFERARRFAFDLRVRYRPVGEKHWHYGRMENISRSGVLFRTDHILDIDTPVLMSFVLPGGAEAPAIVCRGHVVRTVLPGQMRSAPGMAATISAYRFVRGLKTPV